MHPENTKLAEGVLTTPSGQKLAWSVRTLPATEKYEESFMLDVIEMNRKTPVRSVSLRARAREDLSVILLALAEVV